MKKNFYNQWSLFTLFFTLLALPSSGLFSQGLNCPSDVILEAIFDGTACTATVELIATEDVTCDTPNPMNNSPFAADNNSLDASGNYPVGVHVVNFSTCDGTNNCSVTVTITSPPPVCVAKDTVLYLDANGMASLTGADLDDGSSEACMSVLTFNLAPSTFSCTDVGDVTATFTATDAENQMCVTDVTVTVVDTFPPVLISNDLTVYLDENGAASVDLADVDNGSTDNCGTPTLTLNVNEQTCADIQSGGFVSVILEDDNGNMTLADLPVTVLDTIPPMVEEVEDIFITLEPGECLGPVSYELPIPTDNCDLPISLTQNLDNTVIEESLSCGVGSMVHYYRIFDMSNSAVDVVIDNINIGVFKSFNSPTVEVIIHELEGDFLIANLTEIASNTMVLGDLDLEFVDYPISATLSNKIYVVEIIAPNFNDNGFIVGANYLGETAPSYFSAIDCGIPEPITNADVGFPNIALLMTLGTTNTYLIEQTEGIASDSIFPMGVTTNVFEYTDGSGNVTELSFDVEVEEYQVQGLSCLTSINLSIDSETCVSSLTPEMVLTTELIGCPDDCVITILTEDDIELPNVFTAMDVGNSYKYEVCCGGNCCWGWVNIEDKTPPQIICSNDTISCGELLVFPFPEAIENCTNVTFTLLNETTEDVSCDDELLSQVITREFIAVDDAGNESNTCFQELSIMKFDIGSVEAPVNAVVPIECGTTFPTDDLGRPDVNFYGGPILNGQDLIQNQALVCNLFVDFEDMTIPTGVNSYSIVRTFRAIYWSCGQDTMSQLVQVFEIGDNLGPVIECPGDLSFDADVLDCGSSIELPALNIEDICGSVQSVSVQYDGGFIDGNGGVANLSLGTNTVTYTAVDQANNISMCTFDVTVEDNVQPIPICDQFTTISLTNEGLAIVDAELFDDGSFDACSPVTIKVRRMNPACNDDDFYFGETVTFCCEDLGSEHMVVLLVTDENGNYNKCMVTAEVQDKTPPTLVQGLPDITVSCDFPFDENNTDQFGTIQTTVDAVEEIILTDDILEFSGPAFDGLALGGCLELMSDEFSFDNLNSCGQGDVFRFITLSNQAGMTITDIQIITFENPDPFDENDVQYPADITLANICDMNDIPLSMPIFTEDVCDQVGIDIDDQIIDNSNGSGSCLKVIRTFTLIDWCQTNNNTFDLIEGEQVIEIINTIAPEITSDCNDVSMCSFDDECGDAFIELNLTATDDCTTEEFLNYSYMIDAFSNGVIDITGSTSSASGLYPVGIHTIYWTVNDACGNEDVCSYTFEIENCKTPTPYCLDNLTVGLTPWDTTGDGQPDTEKVIITPDFFDAGSFHVCGTPVQLSFSADVNDVERIFECADIGEQPIQLWVTDVNGNQDFCSTSVDVQDNNTVDLCPDMLMFTISGKVKTENDELVEGAELSLGLPDLLEYTDVNGNYSFSNIPGANAYTVLGDYNMAHTTGITVSDIVLIQKHILGLQPLNSAYKLLAADVDMSEKVNGQDIIQIRKLLLGHYDEFPLNDSWRFFDADQSFIDPANPWINTIEDGVNIPNLSSNTIADFVGVKVGDVNESAMDGFTSGIDTRSGETITFDVAPIAFEAGDYGQIVIAKNDDKIIEGLQLGLTYDTEMFEVIDVLIEGEVASEAQVKQMPGAIKLLLSSDEIGQGIVLNVRASKDMSTTGMKLNDEVFMNMAYAQSEGEMNVELRESTLEVPSEITFSMNQNEPNPWMNLTNIYFTSPTSEKGDFRIMDTNGKVILNKVIDCTKGENNIVVYNNELPASGIYYYELSIGSVRQMKKMILIK